jgi:hypothetical protein
MKTKALALAAGLALVGTTGTAQAFDSDGFFGDRSDARGWGPLWNSHLDPYDGRPLGPPLAALPPGSYYYNRQLVIGGVGPVVVVPRRAVRARPHVRRRTVHRY